MKWEIKQRIFWVQLFQFEWFLFESETYHFALDFRFIFFFFLRMVIFTTLFTTLCNVAKIDNENVNAVSTLSHFVQINTENIVQHNIVLTLFNVINLNVDNVNSTLIWHFPMSRHHINLRTTLKQSWNICWVLSLLYSISYFHINSKLITTIIDIKVWFLIYNLPISLFYFSEVTHVSWFWKKRLL